MVHYFADSYKMNTTSIYVEIGGVRYHATDIPTNNKAKYSFINAKNSLE